VLPVPSKTRTDRRERPTAAGSSATARRLLTISGSAQARHGVLLLGRKTWELFLRIWPGRTDDFSAAMNRMPKLVASRTLTDLSAWQNSSLMSGELLDAVERTKADRDVIVTGSASVVRALEAHDRVDEYRILFFPTALGDGTPLFSPKAAPVQLRLLSAEASGPAILARYERFAR